MDAVPKRRSARSPCRIHGSTGRSRDALAWLTDLHLNFVTPGHVDRLCHAVGEAGADVVLLGGDIGEAPDVEEHLEGLDARLGLPVYFVMAITMTNGGASPASGSRPSASAPARPAVVCPRYAIRRG